MDFLIFSEKDDGAYELLSKASELACDGKIAAFIYGEKASERAKEFISRGASNVFISSDSALKDAACGKHSALLAQLMKESGIDNVLIYSTKRGKEIAGMLAQKLNCGCTTDAMELKAVEDGLQTERYTLGGNTITTETITSKNKVISVMPYAFPKKIPCNGMTGEVKEFNPLPFEERVSVIEKMEKKGETVRLEDADVLLCIGKGFQKKEDLKLAYDFAQAVKAEIGVTRQLATDFGWFSEDRIVGLSGRKTSPKLYFSVGISGQIQHTVGVMRSKVIVSINKNPDAPIFKISDYGIVGDLYKVLPKLTEKIIAIK